MAVMIAVVLPISSRTTLQAKRSSENKNGFSAVEDLNRTCSSKKSAKVMAGEFPFPEYTLFHSALRESPQASSLTWHCAVPCSGFGDRVKGIVSTLFIGAITGRVVFIEQSHPARLESMYIPASDINWTAPLHVREAWDNASLSTSLGGLNKQAPGYILAGKSKKCDWILDYISKVRSGPQHVKVTLNFHWEVVLGECVDPSMVNWTLLAHAADRLLPDAASA